MPLPAKRRSAKTSFQPKTAKTSFSIFFQIYLEAWRLSPPTSAVFVVAFGGRSPLGYMHSPLFSAVFDQNDVLAERRFG